MKFFSLLVVGIAALSFSACEKQPYSKLEVMESPFRHDHAAEVKAEESKTHSEQQSSEQQSSEQKATQ